MRWLRRLLRIKPKRSVAPQFAYGAPEYRATFLRQDGDWRIYRLTQIRPPRSLP